MLKKKHHITSIGTAAIDIFFYTDQAQLIRTPQHATSKKLLALEYGAKLVSDDVYLCPGGGAANTAATFANLGLRPAILSSIGSDALGREIIRHCQQMHIGADLMQYQNKEQTAFSFILGGHRWQDHVILHHLGASNAFNLTADVAKKISSPWIYLNALHGSRSATSLSALMQRVARQEMKLYWNPSPNEIINNWPKVKKLLPLMEGLQLNYDEAIEVLLARGQAAKNIQPKNAIRLLHEFGQNITVITNGDKGAYVYDGKKIFYKSASATKIVSTTGAGDAFGSGLVAGLIKFNHNLNRALALGMSNAASVLGQVGAQTGLLLEKDIKRLNI